MASTTSTTTAITDILVCSIAIDTTPFTNTTTPTVSILAIETYSTVTTTTAIVGETTINHTTPSATTSSFVATTTTTSTIVTTLKVMMHVVSTSVSTPITMTIQEVMVPTVVNIIAIVTTPKVTVTSAFSSATSFSGTANSGDPQVSTLPITSVHP